MVELGMTVIINIPLFIIAWRHFGLEFMLASLSGMGISSVFVDTLALSGYIATLDPMLGAIIGGVINQGGGPCPHLLSAKRLLRPRRRGHCRAGK